MGSIDLAFCLISYILPMFTFSPIFDAVVVGLLIFSCASLCWLNSSTSHSASSEPYCTVVFTVDSSFLAVCFYFINQSLASAKRNVERNHLCLTPVVMLKLLACCLLQSIGK